MKLLHIAFVLLSSMSSIAAADRPNIIFIITDDHDHDTMGCFGGPAPTPHIDALAAAGVRFEHFTTTSPVCTPTRYSCLSGRYAGRAEKMQRLAKPGEPLSIGWETNLEADRPNLQKVLAAAGYRTGMVGKWHLGGLNDDGLDVPENYGPESSLDDPKFVKYLKDRQVLWSRQMREKFGFDSAARIYKGNIHKKNRSPRCIGYHNMEWVVEGAQEFIRQSKDEPFFLYMATTVPHGPQPLPSLHADVRICGEGMLEEAPRTGMPSRESVLKRAKDAGVSARDAWIYWLDDGIGAVRETVEELGLLENTLIIMMSDQEAAGKGSLYDRGVGAPCIASWKGKTSPGTVSDAMAQNIDLAPTFFELASTQAPDNMQLDGKSFAALLRGEDLPKDWRTSQYFEIGLMRAVRTRDWKYIAFRLPTGMKVDPDAKFDTSDVPMFNQFKRREKEFPHWWDADQLYDLTKDPKERTNLASEPEFTAKLAEMKSLLGQRLGELPYGYAEFTSKQSSSAK